jgi:hypothetical protein
MRRALAVAAMCAVAAGAMTGCASDAPTPPAPAAATADETQAVCEQALTAAEKESSDALARIDQILSALAAGRSVAVLKTGLLQSLDGWKTTLYDLKDRPVRPQVRAHLEETITYLDELAATTTLEPLDISSRFAELEDELIAACA